MGLICAYSPESALLSLTYAVILFGSVLLHELGHAIVARDFGCETKDITLYPFGGIAQVKLQADPFKEFYIALAGPTVNAFLCVIAFFGFALGVPLMHEILFLNAIMCLFNLLPSFPMDGGRVVRSILARRPGSDYETATATCLKISKWMSWLYVAIGVATGWIGLVIVGGFLLFVNSRGSIR
jgi:Zn-dependent protease